MYINSQFPTTVCSIQYIQTLFNRMTLIFVKVLYRHSPLISFRQDSALISFRSSHFGSASVATAQSRFASGTALLAQRHDVLVFRPRCGSGSPITSTPHGTTYRPSFSFGNTGSFLPHSNSIGLPTGWRFFLSSSSCNSGILDSSPFEISPPPIRAIHSIIAKRITVKDAGSVFRGTITGQAIFSRGTHDVFSVKAVKSMKSHGRGLLDR